MGYCITHWVSLGGLVNQHPYEETDATRMVGTKGTHCRGTRRDTMGCDGRRLEPSPILYPPVTLGFAQNHDVICSRGGVFCTRVVLFAIAKMQQKG